MKNKTLVIAGSVLSGVGSAITLSSGLAYYIKYKQGKLTDSEWFKSLAYIAALDAAFTGNPATAPAAIAVFAAAADAAGNPAAALAAALAAAALLRRAR